MPEDPTPPPTPLPPKGYTPPPTPPPTIVPPLESPPSVDPVLPVPSPPSVAPVLPVPSPPSVAHVLPVPSPPSVAPVLPVHSPPSVAPVLPVPSPPSVAPVLPVPSPPSVAPVLPVPSPPSVAPVPPVVPSPPKARTPVSATSPPGPAVVDEPSRTIPPPLVFVEEEQKSPEGAAQPVPPAPSNEDLVETAASPKDVGQVSRAAPPPPPPPTYRAVVSLPGPTTGGMGSGASSPARPATPSTPSAVFSSPPPPPPRPTSRPKLPPGKPSKGDMSRPFSPPGSHSSSPPSIAPLAQAESTSSISSNNSLSAATTPTVENDQPSLVWFDRGKFYLTFEGCSRGPSPLTMGAQDTLPVAAAFTETVNAFFKGANPNKCVVKITGEMVLSFPAGITRHFANNPSPAVLTFSITHYSWLEHVLPNPQLLCCDTATTPNPDCKTFWVNMPNLMTHLKKVAEQKPQATYYNVDMLKYQVSAQGLTSTPLNLAASWRCEPTSTDLRIDYKYNGGSMTTPVALNNVQFLIPVDGGVTKLLAVLPPAAWNAEQQRILWKIPDISQKSENGGIGSLLARFQLSEGPSKPSPLAVQFTSEGSTLSGCDIELAGPGYRFSLIKKRFAAGKYLADN
ncbi:SH3-containing GRB2-like protein 3-interacting protein 1 isoform X9 [Oncorhynchus kisutch]|uniref:SH3-containing GRB2-like protein 3-interacting protein 1 isoform X9 n=1 Tax=Oncorhynchus kisutch TaxID=8019 RepID=UPI0012DD4F02|nr:SH3-containing GRB2-like protein 3-interacting protein 1 isoform X9 [Oncorhynchus kisutch]